MLRGGLAGVMAGAIGLPLACSVERTPPQLAVPASHPPTASGRDKSLVAIRASSGTPAGFVLDGDVSEWSTLADAPRPAHDATPDPDAPIPVRNAASHVAVALTPTGALLAGDLRGEAASGVWIALGFASLDLPIIGSWESGGGTRELVCQEVGETLVLSNDHIVTAADKTECEATLASAATFAAAHFARFRRRYLVDATGVRYATESGTTPLPTAQVSWKRAEYGATFEVELPALALPRCGEAPVREVSLLAARGSGPAPRDDAAVWPLFELDPPIGFAPYADHRAVLFADLPAAYLSGPYSYQPGDPLGIECAGYAPQKEFPFADRTTRHTYASLLIEKERTFGDLEIGSIQGQGTAVWRNGVLLGTAPVSASEWVERDGELIGIRASQWINEDSWTDGASFYAFSIRPDGTFREDLLQPTDPQFSWGSVDEATHTKDLRKLVIRGTLHEAEPRETITVTWTYDEKTRDYRSKVTRAPRRSIPR